MIRWCKDNNIIHYDLSFLGKNTGKDKSEINWHMRFADETDYMIAVLTFS